MEKDGLQQKIIDSLTPHIKKWAKDGKKIIIGIEGNSGAGKTTLSFYLNTIFPNSCRLSMDLFIKGDKQTVGEKNLDYFSNNFFDVKLAESYIKKFKNSKEGDVVHFNVKGKKIEVDLHKQILFLDGIFFFNNSIGTSHLDKNILLVLEKKELIKRRLARSKRHSAEYDDTLATKIDSAWEEYYNENKPNKKSDITLHLEVL